MPAAWIAAPYSRSNSVPHRSMVTASATAEPGRSSIPFRPFSQTSTGAVMRAPAPTTRSSLMAAAMSVPPVHVSVMAPPRMMPSSPLIAFSGQPTAENDSRPWTVVC